MRKPFVSVLVFLLAMSAVVFAGCGSNNEAPVAAHKAQIEMTYTGDGTSYVGDRKIIQGTASITFSNETTDYLTVDAYRYVTGSDDLAPALAEFPEGNRLVPTGRDATPPGENYLELNQLVRAGNNTWTMDLVPGTYVFDAGASDFVTTGLWRVAVIEVVDE